MISPVDRSDHSPVPTWYSYALEGKFEPIVIVIFPSPPITNISFFSSFAVPTTGGADGPSAFLIVPLAVPVTVPVSTELVTSTVIFFPISASTVVYVA